MFTECTDSALFLPSLCILFFIFEERARFCFFEERRKQGGNVFVYVSRPLGQCHQKFCSQCQSSPFLKLASQSVSVVFPCFCLVQSSLDQRAIISTFCSHSSNHRGSIYKHCYSGEKLIQTAKWWPLVNPIDILCPLNWFFSIYLTFSAEISGICAFIRCFNLNTLCVHLIFICVVLQPKK